MQPVAQCPVVAASILGGVTNAQRVLLDELTTAAAGAAIRRHHLHDPRALLLHTRKALLQRHVFVFVVVVVVVVIIIVFFLSLLAFTIRFRLYPLNPFTQPSTFNPSCSFTLPLTPGRSPRPHIPPTVHYSKSACTSGAIHSFSSESHQQFTCAGSSLLPT